MELLYGVVVIVLVGAAYLVWSRGGGRGRRRTPEAARDQEPGQDRPRNKAWDPRRRYEEGPPRGRRRP